MKRNFSFMFDTEILTGHGCELIVDADSLAEAIQKLGVADEHLVSIAITPLLHVFDSSVHDTKPSSPAFEIRCNTVQEIEITRAWCEQPDRNGSMVCFAATGSSGNIHYYGTSDGDFHAAEPGVDARIDLPVRLNDAATAILKRRLEEHETEARHRYNADATQGGSPNRYIVEVCQEDAPGGPSWSITHDIHYMPRVLLAASAKEAVELFRERFGIVEGQLTVSVERVLTTQEIEAFPYEH